MHASNHAALSGHICPVDHLLCIVEVQCYCIIKTLLYESVIGTIQVQFSQVVPIGKDQVGLFIRCGLANSGVIGAELKAVDAETVEAAVCVDTALGTGVGGCALIYIHTCLPIALQLETRMTPALEADLKVVTELCAAAQLAVETLVDKAVEFIGAITTVVVAVAQQCLIQTFFIMAHES